MQGTCVSKPVQALCVSQHCATVAVLELVIWTGPFEGSALHYCDAHARDRARSLLGTEDFCLEPLPVAS